MYDSKSAQLAMVETSLKPAKCARLGCDRAAWIDNSLFCRTCIATGRDVPNTTCDNLPAIRDVN